jgi:hypothetical protein
VKTESSQAAPGGFDEHERDTAQRAYPQEIVERSDPHATTRIARFELEKVLEKASGTRPAVTSEEIERLARERKARTEQQAAARAAEQAAEVAQAPRQASVPEVSVEGLSESELEENIDALGTPEPQKQKEFRFAELPRWFVPVAALSVGILVSAAFAAGIVLGRLSALP